MPVTPTAEEPPVRWENATSITNWELGGPVPKAITADSVRDAQKPLIPSQVNGNDAAPAPAGQSFQEHMKLLLKMITQTQSHDERMELFNMATSSSYRKSHPERIMREIVHQLDEVMTHQEKLCGDAEHTLNRQALEFEEKRAKELGEIAHRAAQYEMQAAMQSQNLGDEQIELTQQMAERIQKLERWLDEAETNLGKLRAKELAAEAIERKQREEHEAEVEKMREELEEVRLEMPEHQRKAIDAQKKLDAAMKLADKRKEQRDEELRALKNDTDRAEAELRALREGEQDHKKAMNKLEEALNNQMFEEKSLRDELKRSVQRMQTRLEERKELKRKVAGKERKKRREQGGGGDSDDDAFEEEEEQGGAGGAGAGEERIGFKVRTVEELPPGVQPGSTEAVLLQRGLEPEVAQSMSKYLDPGLPPQQIDPLIIPYPEDPAYAKRRPLGGEQSQGLAGVGVQLAKENKEGAHVMVRSVSRGGPAEKAGVKAGDVLLQIEGVNARLLTADRAYGYSLGAVGSVCKMRVENEELEVKTFNVPREDGHEPLEFWSPKDDEYVDRALLTRQSFPKDAQEWRKKEEIKNAGVGLIVEEEDGDVIVTEVVRGGSAYEDKGIQLGAKVLKVDGASTDRGDAAAFTTHMLRGEEGSTVEVVVDNGEGEGQQTLKLVRKLEGPDGRPLGGGDAAAGTVWAPAAVQSDAAGGGLDFGHLWQGDVPQPAVPEIEDDGIGSDGDVSVDQGDETDDDDDEDEDALAVIPEENAADRQAELKQKLEGLLEEDGGELDLGKKVTCAITWKTFPVARLLGVAEPPTTPRRGGALDNEKLGLFLVQPQWKVAMSPFGQRLLAQRDVVGLYAVEVSGDTSKLIAQDGSVINQFPCGSPVAAGHPPEWDRLDWVLATAARVKNVVCAAIKADLSSLSELPSTDTSAQSPPAYDTPPAPGSTFSPGKHSRRCCRWIRTDNTVLSVKASGRVGFLLVESLDAVLWGRMHPQVDELEGDARECIRNLTQAVEEVGWKRESEPALAEKISLCPTIQEAEQLPPLVFEQRRVLPLALVTNVAPFDASVIGGRGKLAITSGGAVASPANTLALSKMGPHETATVRTASGVQCRPGSLGVKTDALLHYFEIRVDGNCFGLSVGVVAAATQDLNSWFPPDSLRLEFDGCLRGKGLFDKVKEAKPDNSRVMKSGDRIGVLLDLLQNKIGWLINSRLVVTRTNLQLAHNKCKDLRFMVSLRATVVTIVKAEKANQSLRAGLKWKRWLDMPQRPARERAWEPLQDVDAEEEGPKGVTSPGSAAVWS